ncbi:MAG: hypothetical protein ABIQ56_02125, partial [Chitinophagaceae bacterium]
ALGSWILAALDFAQRERRSQSLHERLAQSVSPFRKTSAASFNIPQDRRSQSLHKHFPEGLF